MMTVNRALNENPNSKKNKSKLNQLNMQLSSINNRISKTEELILEDGPVLDLAAALLYVLMMKFIIYQVDQILNIISIWAHIIYNGI